MMTVLVAGAAAGGGVYLCRRGVMGVAPPLERALANLERAGTPVGGPRSGLSARRHGERWTDLLPTFQRAGRESDLAVCHRREEELVAEKLTTSVALAGVGVVLSLALIASGNPFPVPANLAVITMLVVVGSVVPDLTLRSSARSRRDAFRHALSSYLDLVNVLLAGGAGIETALVAAAEAGDGWVFEHLRDELVRARATRRSPWDCFRDLGERLGVGELVELSATVQLAGEHGARVKQTLVARAAAMRSHQLARLEADAQSATERMGLPTVLMFVGFIALLGYPALHLIVGGL